MKLDLFKNFRERNYFNPEKTNEVVREDLVKILRGEVVDNIWYMVVSVPREHPFNSWAGQDFGSNGHDLCWEDNSVHWYGKFAVDQTSAIVVPKKLEIEFDYKQPRRVGRVLVSELRRAPHWTGGFLQSDKDCFTKTLVTDINREELYSEVRRNFKGYDIDGSLRKLD